MAANVSISREQKSRSFKKRREGFRRYLKEGQGVLYLHGEYGHILIQAKGRRVITSRCKYSHFACLEHISFLYVVKC